MTYNFNGKTSKFVKVSFVTLLKLKLHRNYESLGISVFLEEKKQEN